MDTIWIQLFNYCKFHEMKSIETLEDFYKRKFEWLPEDLNRNIGHFNMFEIDSHANCLSIDKVF